ncbi:MAG: putative zinc-binding metallopeptidase [Planctomycetota bacterium]
MASKDAFRESNWSSLPIRDLELEITGTPLEPVLRDFEQELVAAGVKLKPHFYLSTEWGVVPGTIALAIPFYLAHPKLSEKHADEVGHLEGRGREEQLRYLRHEMGHVVNYAWRLYDEEEWVKLFGPITRPYLEDYRPSPFSRRYVRHLPGWYAQKHPDEDWAETFAVWMTPGRDWRTEYADHAMALAKLEYCDRTMNALRDRPPIVTSSETDEEVKEIPYSVEQFYKGLEPIAGEFPHGLDGALRAIFEDLAPPAAPQALPEGDAPIAMSMPAASTVERKPASGLLRSLERGLLDNVYRWTGHFPERTRTLVRHLAQRADELGLAYPAGEEAAASLAVTTLVTALAMNHVTSGNYLP